MNKETHEALLAFNRMIEVYDPEVSISYITKDFNRLMKLLLLVDACEKCDDYALRFPDKFEYPWAYYRCYKCGFKYKCSWPPQ